MSLIRRQLDAKHHRPAMRMLNSQLTAVLKFSLSISPLNRRTLLVARTPIESTDRLKLRARAILRKLDQLSLEFGRRHPSECSNLAERQLTGPQLITDRRQLSQRTRGPSPAHGQCPWPYQPARIAIAHS